MSEGEHDQISHQVDPEGRVAAEREAFAASDDANHPSVIGGDEEITRLMRRKSRRSFLVMGIAAAGGIAGWEWLKTRSEIDGIPYPLRRAHEFNEQLAESYFKGTRLAPTFARSPATEPRVNGGEGMADDFDPVAWRLQVIGLADPTKYPQYVKDVNYETELTGDSNMPDDSADNSDEADGDVADDDSDDDSEESGNNKDSKNTASGTAKQKTDDNEAETTPAADLPEPGLLLTLDDIKRLPRVEMTTQLKCIEGWSVIVNWAGARLADFAQMYQPAAQGGSSPDVTSRPQDLVRYVSLETPDGEYYVGLDMASALHPQTLLCYEMNGQPLSMEHGAPLRLVTPVKYGIKNIKRIGRIAFTDTRPADFWAERGYDWYSGH